MSRQLTKLWQLQDLCTPWDRLVRLMVWAWHIPLEKSSETLLLTLDKIEELNPFIFPPKGKFSPPPPPPPKLLVAWASNQWGLRRGIRLWQWPMGMTCYPCDVRSCCHTNMGGPQCVIGCPDHCQHNRQLSSNCWSCVASNDLWSREDPAGLLDAQVGCAKLVVGRILFLDFSPRSLDFSFWKNPGHVPLRKCINSYFWASCLYIQQSWKYWGLHISVSQSSCPRESYSLI